MSASEIAQLQKFVADNDPEAFRGIFMTHKDMVFTVARRILGDAAEAEDVAQECFIELARRSFEMKPPLAGWLHRVAVQRSINVARNKAARQLREQRFAANQELSTDATWDKISPKVDEALDGLSEDVRVPLVMQFLEGRPQTEIAEILKVDQATVSRRIKKGISDLRSRLDDALPLALLEAALLTNGMQPAPATLTANLGKLALSVASGAAGTSAMARLVGALMNTKIILVAIVSALAAVALTLVVQSRNHESGVVAPVAGATSVAPQTPLAPPADPAANAKEREPMAIAPAMPQWQVISSKYARIHYATQYERDARNCETDVADAVNAIVKDFSDKELDKFWSNIELDIFLHAAKGDKVAAGIQAWNMNVKNGKQTTIFEMLTASAPDNIGFDGRYARKQVFATVVVMAMSQVTYEKPSGWKAHQAPSWFYPGIGIYIASMRSSEQAGIVEQQKYLEEFRAHPERLSNALKSPDRNRNAELVVPARFLVETYGMEKIRKLLLSEKPSFWAAAETELGMSPDGLYESSYHWLTGNPPPTPESKDF